MVTSQESLEQWCRWLHKAKNSEFSFNCPLILYTTCCKKKAWLFCRGFLPAVCCIAAVVGLPETCLLPLRALALSGKLRLGRPGFKRRLMVTWQRCQSLSPSEKGLIVSRVSDHVYFFCLEKVKLGEGKPSFKPFFIVRGCPVNSLPGKCDF